MSMRYQIFVRFEYNYIVISVLKMNIIAKYVIILVCCGWIFVERYCTPRGDSALDRVLRGRFCTIAKNFLMDNFRPLNSGTILIFLISHPFIPVYLPNLDNYVARQHILEVPYMWLHKSD